MKCRFPLVLLPAIFLSACAGPAPSAVFPAASPSAKPEAIGNEAATRKSARDGYAVDLKELLADASPKAEVLAKFGDHVSEITGLSQLEDLDHDESSPFANKGSSDEIDQLFLTNKETYYVRAEGGNDILLFFNIKGRLADYIHM